MRLPTLTAMLDTSCASAAVLATQWAITPDMLSTILAIAERTNVDAILSGNPQRLAGTRSTSIVDGVALIPIIGPIFPRANMFTDVSGATSIETLASDFTAALRNPAVHGIVFDIDSPGGAVSGVSELVDVIAAARGTKPIKAYSSGSMASAAYWIAAATGEIIVNATAIAGNVGVVAQVVRDKGDAVQFVSSQSPNKRPSLDTDAGKAEIQRTVDHLAAVFVSSVSRLRGVTDVVARFGAGAIMVGQHAVNAGMADRIGSLASVIASIRRTATTTQPKPVQAVLPAMTAEDRVAHRWRTEPALRAEFGDSFAAFSHFERAAASGRVRIIGRRTL